ncbi:hypothetical protein CN692_24205 [Bacillus sp. AFS002410]|uniref:hypothetical protein n=1 Tax=Bacillus sp. AFS002410 TaxID=2033481 RepID=UPI000BF2123F|nr:hypothetical protein [Bacillus sp. AFS002410]PEJ48213.1 hypothetical protein CN692_24205 [Bacillus sp. AFS002410]
MKLKVITHSGMSIEIEVESYDPIVLNEQLNDRDISTVLIGDVIISRIDIKFISPVETPSE